MSAGSMSRSDKEAIKWMISSWKGGYLFGSIRLKHWYSRSVGSSLFNDWGGFEEEHDLTAPFNVEPVWREANEKS